ncbi:MAG TPA: HlyD family secretion protein [Caulobacteraceae bacterium]|nr:HlyD family secretion protein [Caulobacteraceae bacterium]
MLQDEDDLAGGSVALRDLPGETNRQPAPSVWDGRAATRAKDAPRNGRPRRWLALSLGALLLAPVVGCGYLYWDSASHFETTDDAFIAARQFAVAPKVAGYITAVPVTDNEHVAAGQVIAQIDQRDYRTALQQAVAEVAAARASIGNTNAQIAVQQAAIAQNESQVEQARASLTFAEQQATRYGILAREGAGTVQDEQQYASQLRQGQAAVQGAQAALVASVRQLAVLKAQLASAEANLEQAIASRDQARLNLSYTTIEAAEPGRIVQLSAAVGEYVTAGTSLAMFVPDQIWVTANFKETQLDHMRPGEPATIHIDAYPGRTIQGHVASIQPGSGTAFSLLPAENATGNYVKVVQRVPVKIIMDHPPADVALGPGMSVEPSVRVNPKPSLYARLKGWL